MLKASLIAGRRSGHRSRTNGVRSVPGLAFRPDQIGEAVLLGLSRVLAQSPRYPVTCRYRYPLIDNDTPAGEKYVTTLSRHALRTVSMEFRLRAVDDRRQLRDQLYGAARGQANPIVLIPLDDDPDVVIYGRLAPNLDTDLVFLNQWTAKVEVSESPFPLSGPIVVLAPGGVGPTAPLLRRRRSSCRRRVA